jgi:hypothetical protein
MQMKSGTIRKTKNPASIGEREHQNGFQRELTGYDVIGYTKTKTLILA